MKTILAPLDFSQVSEGVVAESITLARALNGRVVLLAVVQPPVVTYEYVAVMENLAEITAAGERNAERRLLEIEAKFKAEGVPVESMQLVGGPIPLIIEQAKKVNADYIVMGSHGHTAFYDLLVGSTTHGVLTRASCPVVIIPAPQQGKRAKPNP